MRSFNLELSAKGNQEHITKTKQSRDEIAADLEQLLASRNGSGAEQWQVQSWRDELAEVDRSIAMVQSLRYSGAADFQIVSPAVASPMPSKSNRRLLAIGASGFFGMMGLAMVVATELGQTRVRTRGELATVVSEPVFAVLTHDDGVQSKPSSNNHEQIRTATRAILKQVRGNRILMLGCHRGDGCTTLTQQIASCVARQRKRVTILDGDLQGETPWDTDETADESVSFGLSDLIERPKMPVNDAVRPTQLGNLQVVPRGQAELDPDLLGSQRMHSVVSELADQSDFLFIDGSPVCDSTDADFLTEHVDGVVLVVKSRGCSRFELKRLADRLRDAGTPLLGVILTDVDPIYEN